MGSFRFSIIERVVLVPGFEPGSTDREPVMMDHYTIPAVIWTSDIAYLNSTNVNLKVKIEKKADTPSITFSLSVYSLFQHFICSPSM